MKKTLVQFCLVALCLAASACASKNKEQQLDRDIKVQTPADSPEQIAQRAAMAFSNAEGLEPEQKVKLAAIYSNVYHESKKIRREMGQAKSLLFMTLAKVDYKSSEITALKKKIVSLDQDRLNLMFKALDDVQAIVGHGINAEKLYKHFEQYELPSRHIRDYNF